MTILWITLILLAFIILFILLVKVFRGKTAKKEEPKTEAKQDKQSDIKQEDKDDIPEILAEVTRGNYMQDRAKQYANSNDITIADMKETKVNLKPKHRIQPVEQIEEDEQPLDTEAILNEVDGVTQSGISKEFAGLSKEMKVLIISNALNKKVDE